jgi:hypothetical protein
LQYHENVHPLSEYALADKLNASKKQACSGKIQKKAEFLRKRRTERRRCFKRCLERFNIENVEMLWRRAPPPAPQAQAKLVSPLGALRGRLKIKLL